MSQRAIFLDRDGTLVHARHYPSQPGELVLYEGIGPGLRRLQAAGFQLVVITNQAGVARGYFTEESVRRMNQYLCEELSRLSVHVDGVYYCPHHVNGIVPELAVECDCRKPRPGMILKAAAELDLDLPGSWFVGDILDDVEAGNRAGCRTVLIDLGTESPSPVPLRRPHLVARDTVHALAMIATLEHLGPACDLAYLPQSWQCDSPLPAALGGSHA
jgi:D-glycero-D-manno-heptose 1,7-bisphosphate phosphatase